MDSTGWNGVGWRPNMTINVPRRACNNYFLGGQGGDGLPVSSTLKAPAAPGLGNGCDAATRYGD